MSVLNSVENTIAENLGGLAHKLAGPGQKFSLEQTPDQSSKVAVVTGGSEGIGYGVTYTLLKHNIAKLYVLSVSDEVVRNAKDAIAKDLGKAAADKTVWMKCDISDWGHVKEIAQKIRRLENRLDILVNNAGRGIMSYQLTEYGVDRHMAVNHFGHAVLTSSLLPLMKKTAESGSVVRVVNLASNVHEKAPKDVKFNSLEELNQDLGPRYQYGRSKLAAVLYVRYFSRTVTNNGYPRFLMNATHPGIVSTKQSKDDIHEAYPLAGYGMSVGFELFKKNQLQGAVSTVFAATATSDSGTYICPPAITEPGSEASQDPQLADDLMALTRRVVAQKVGFELEDH